GCRDSWRRDALDAPARIQDSAHPTAPPARPSPTRRNCVSAKPGSKSAARAARPSALPRPVPVAVAFATGWTILMPEILVGRLLAPFFGYSIYQWGALIGVVMAALAFGYYLGGRVGDRPDAGRFLLTALVVSLVFVL